MTTTEGRLYFIDVVTRERLEIQFVPLELEVVRGINMEAVAIVGRNTPRYEYIGGEKSISLKLDFHANNDDKQDALAKAKWIEQRTYNDGYAAPATRIQLVWGDMFKNEVWVIKSCPYRLSQFDKTRGFFPSQVYMDLTLGLSVNHNLRKKDVR